MHHGLFWPGLRAVTGSLYRALRLAFEHNLALYSVHLPLDLHPQIGNNALLAAALGLEKTKPFLELKGQPAGLLAEVCWRRDELIAKLEDSLGGPVRCIGAGPMETKRIGIVTGGAGGEIYAAAGEGIDTYITGEAPHWAAVAAEELGIEFIGWPPTAPRPAARTLPRKRSLRDRRRSLNGPGRTARRAARSRSARSPAPRLTAFYPSCPGGSLP